MIVTIITFIIILAILVFVHEFGHFIVAIKSGMKVDEFGFGFPPRVAGFQRIDGKFVLVWGNKPPADPEKTVYSINAIPLGGFVKIVGENNEHEDDPRSFINRPFWGRFLTLIAGVCMNVILAWLLITIGYAVGLPAAVDSFSQIPANAHLQNVQVSIIEVVPGSPAEKAGLRAGDAITAIDNKQLGSNGSNGSVEDAQQIIRSKAGQEIAFTIQRGKQQQTINVASRANPGPNEGPTGISLAYLGRLQFSWYRAPIEGARTTWFQIENIFSGLYQLVTGKVGLAAVGGPVKIAKLTGEVAGLGFVYLLQFTAFLSLNLAALNILPFPALDGGRVLFLLIEKFRGKRNNQKVEQIVNTAGFVFLLLLMVLVTIKDIVKK